MSLETIKVDALEISPGDTVLDLGCGEGRHTISTYLLHEARVYGVDLRHQDLTTASRRLQEICPADDATPTAAAHAIQFAVANGHQLPFADDSFDVVVCSEVLEHIIDYHSVLGEIQRVLKPSGQLAVSVPRFFPEWVCWRLSREYHEVEGGHVRIFRTGELKRTIEGFSFEFTHRHWAHSLHVPYWWLRCLQWRGGEEAPLARWYHKLLVWDLLQRPWLTRLLDRLLNPIMGKSVVLYFKPQS